MKKTFPTFVFFVALSFGATAPLFSQASEVAYDHRIPGDREVIIQMGGVLPLFFQDFSGNVGPTNLSLGGDLGINVNFYLSERFKLGGDLRGKLSFSPNGITNPLFMVPITLKATWDFNSSPFVFPVGIGAGICLTSYQSATNIDPFLMPTAGAYWNMNSSWSFGLDAAYWLDFQVYFGGNGIPASQSMMGHFLDLNLAAIYHF